MTWDEDTWPEDTRAARLWRVLSPVAWAALVAGAVVMIFLLS